jgi:peptidoglycan hydrolase-like protein with peptidoglycan-binding domain
VKPKLEYASQGPFVVEAQIKLNTLLPDAQPPLTLDGKYFDKTVARVKQFQKSRGLSADASSEPRRGARSTTWRPPS